MTQKYNSSVYCDSYKALDATNKFAFHVSPVIKVRHEGFILLSGAISTSLTFFFFPPAEKTLGDLVENDMPLCLFIPKLWKY